MPGVLTVVDDTFEIRYVNSFLKSMRKNTKKMGLEISEFLANAICFQISTATQNYMAHGACAL